MKTYLFILFVIIISICGCNNKPEQTVKQNGTNASKKINPENAAIPLSELEAINRNLSKQVSENFRSWSYNEPERWEYLSNKFAEEVILSCPDATLNKEKIAQVFLTHLTQRAGIYKGNAIDKQAMMGHSASEFKYNLSFLIGIEGYQNWQSLSKNEFQKFNLKRDSLQKLSLAVRQNFRNLKYQNHDKKNPNFIRSNPNFNVSNTDHDKR
ncbi:MAG: hypothetical protein Q8P34_01290 [Bacteroidota bacterium]|nr:hypothetical protein [Bacteroidota bacterium]